MRRISIYAAVVATLVAAQWFGTARAQTVTATTVFEYRLEGANSTTQGRLEVRPANTTSAWGTVCNDVFGSADAAVACVSLGFPNTTTAYYRTAYSAEQGSSSQPIYMDNLGCLGNETRLDECSRAASHNCAHYEDIYLGCGVAVAPTPAPPAVTGVPTPAGTLFEYRLSGGTSNATGRLEVRPVNNTGAWGTVCNDFFTSVDAGVACVSLGFPRLISYRTVYSAEQGSSSQPIYMDDLGCTGNEVRLDQCSRASSPNCAHYEDVFVTCGAATSAPAPTPAPPGSVVSDTVFEYRLVGGTATTNGRLEVRPANTTQSWGTVCDDSFDSTDAGVACRSLGMTTTGARVTYTPAGYTNAGSSSQPIYMDDLRCGGSEARLDQCARASSHNCGHSEDVVLDCNYVVPTPQPPLPTSFAAGVSFEYRLYGGSASHGRLEVRPAGLTSSWGTVCDDSFETVDAIVACRSLGFTTASASSVGYRPPSAFSEWGSSSQTIWFDDLACAGTETQLHDCTRRTSGHNCGHSEDVILSCESTTVASATSSFASAVSDGRVTAAVQYALVATIRVSGIAYAQLDAAGRASFAIAIGADLARLMGVANASHVGVSRVTAEGDSVAVVEFTVSVDAGVQSTLLVRRLRTAPHLAGSWLPTTQGVVTSTSSLTGTLSVVAAPEIVYAAPAGVVTVLPPNVVAAITARVRITGTAFAGFLTGSAFVRSELAAAAAYDLGRLLGVDAAYVVITNMTLGSLIVDFSVSSNAGVQPGTLSSRLATATTATWLTATQGMYASASSETLTVSEAPTVSAMAAPGAVTPAPATSSASQTSTAVIAAFVVAATVLLA